MCGIVGVVSGYKSGFSNPEVEAFQRMLFIDTFRGWDSTGVFGADKYANVGILKEASMAPVFMQKPEFKEWSNKLSTSGVFAVGHNRAATRGTIKDENAHPFWIENNIVLVQNGTYYGDHKHLKDTEVDTEAIAHVINEEDTVEKALNRINSAYALVWYNVRERSLNLIRNDQRPLHVVYTASGAMLFASEEETLRFAISKAGWKTKQDPYMIKEDTLVKLTFDKEGGHESENIPISRTRTFLPTQHGNRVLGHVGGGRSHDQTRFPLQIPDTPRPSRRYSGVDGPHVITKQFFDIFPGDSNEYDLAKEDVTTIQELYRGLLSSRRQVVVETQDYFAANSDEHCQVWYVLATILSPNPNILDKVALHWTLTNISEADVYKYVTQESWFDVTLGNLIISKFGDRYIARAYCTGIKSLHTIKTEE